VIGNTQKSNTTVEDLKKISIAAASAINGCRRKSLGGIGGRTSLVGCGDRVYQQHKKRSCWCSYQTFKFDLVLADKASLYTIANKRKLLCYYDCQGVL
ncbi:unnamed protein product, partial [Brassica rapa subsp. trilocularis]